MSRVFIVLIILIYSINNQAYSALFGSYEVKSADLQHFSKWLNSINRFSREKSYLDSLSASRNIECNNVTSCMIYDWKDNLKKMQNMSFEQKLIQVNRYINQSSYIVDPVNWGVKDYWASPGQFLVRDGDCEDYAIAKFMSLKYLGVDENNMRIVILMDQNLGVIHAVLAVYDPKRKNYWILDNQIQDIMPDYAIYHYMPIYSINESNWWHHG